jgi:hypothetical protein
MMPWQHLAAASGPPISNGLLRCHHHSLDQPVSKTHPGVDSCLTPISLCLKRPLLSFQRLAGRAAPELYIVALNVVIPSCHSHPTTDRSLKDFDKTRSHTFFEDPTEPQPIELLPLFRPGRQHDFAKFFAATTSFSI